jgi:hypothetical protein
MEWSDWVPWVIGVFGFFFGVHGEFRAHRAENRMTRADEVSPWDEARWLSGDVFAIKNSSTRDVIVTSILADYVPTTETVNNFKPLTELPYRVNAGDSIEFDREARYTLARPGAVLEWHFADRKDTGTTRRIVTGLNPSDR